MSQEINILIKNMIETMYKFNGVGLAANQVGCLYRIVTIDISEKRNSPIVLINPEIVKKRGKTYEIEGCLSFPGLYLKIKRKQTIKIKYLNEKMEKMDLEADGLLSRVIQHEIDHLNGITFVDRLPFLKRLKIYSMLKKK